MFWRLGLCAAKRAASVSPCVLMILILQIIIVSGAEEIKAFENDPSIGRPGEGKIPGWFFALVKVSKFYCVATKRWWIGMEGSNNPSRVARVEYIQKSLADGLYVVCWVTMVFAVHADRPCRAGYRVGSIVPSGTDTVVLRVWFANYIPDFIRLCVIICCFFVCYVCMVWCAPSQCW
jgi:hypothetical protein